MRALYRKFLEKEEFFPGILGIALNSAYFFRRGLLHAIRTHASSLTGVVLDFGCGKKPYANLIPAAHYIGLDVPVSGHRPEDKYADVYFDGASIPLKAASVDGILASEALEHVFELRKILLEFFRILKPGGTVLITCPFCWHEHEAPYDFARYTRFALDYEFALAGFEVISQEKAGTFIETLAQLSLLYCNEHLRPCKGPIGAILSVFYNSIFNMLGIFANSLLPKRWDLYLGNVFLLRKPIDRENCRTP
jgi:SAM-dependent methyltransferase